MRLWRSVMITLFDPYFNHHLLSGEMLNLDHLEKYRKVSMSTTVVNPTVQQTGAAPAGPVQAVNPVLNQITVQTLTYAPGILAAILAAEQVQGATGSQKLNAVLQVATQSLESSPNANVAEVAALANVAVQVWNILGLFTHKTPAPPLTPAANK